jgi:predicted translin family RNA/ssDNA-binding protein
VGYVTNFVKKLKKVQKILISLKRFNLEFLRSITKFSDIIYELLPNFNDPPKIIFEMRGKIDN